MIDRRALALARASTVVAMLAMPAGRSAGPLRQAMSSVVVVSLLATTVLGAAGRWGRGRAGIAITATSLGSAAIEVLGVRTGRPFGRYRYTDALRPQFAGVPIIVPMAWAAMALPARETAHAALGRRSNPRRRVLLGAAALTAWDVFLDPQMVSEGFWRWASPGRYRGIPLTNFAGWFITGLAAMAALELAVPPREPVPELVAEYGAMATMETVGFATVFGDRTVALIGGTAMLPVALIAAARLVGQRS